MKVLVGTVLVLQLLLAPQALAQESGTQQETVQQPAAAPQFTVTQLLARGFDVKAMAFTNGAIVLVLQGGIDAFVCETNGGGQTRACVALK